MIRKGIYTINEDPKIISFYGHEVIDFVKKSYNTQDQQPLYCLIHITWNHALPHRMLKKKWAFHQLKSLGITPLLATNSKQEDIYRKLFGIQGLQCITYIYIDEGNYKVLDLEKQYEAIYAAQLIPFKRLELIQDIDKVFVLTYVDGANQWNLHHKYPLLSHVKFNSEWVSTNDKNLLFNQAKVALALSKEEGAMMANVEYLLSGLPVVSTKSQGGRDQYYDEEYCLIVKDTAKAVSEGVQELVRRNISPQYIREQTLKKIDKDRNRYVDFICDFVKKDIGEVLDPELIKKTLFNNPLNSFKYLDNIHSSSFLDSFLYNQPNQKTKLSQVK